MIRTNLPITQVSPLYPATFHIQGSMVEAIWDAIVVIAEGLLA